MKSVAVCYSFISFSLLDNITSSGMFKLSHKEWTLKMTDLDDSHTFFIIKLQDTVSSDEVNLTVVVCAQAPIHCQESNYPLVYVYTSHLDSNISYTSIQYTQVRSTLLITCSKCVNLIFNYPLMVAVSFFSPSQRESLTVF